MKKVSTTISVGQIFTNKYGEYQVTEYLNYKNVKIKWLYHNIEIWARGGDIIRGEVKNPLFPIVYGVGYTGIGPFIPYPNNKISKARVCWGSMLQRCYYEKMRGSWQSYADVTVNEHWHNFQNFAEWFENNYVDGWHLDKDILVKGNKEYGPDVCCFVPEELNRLFIKNKGMRGLYPIGVTLKKKNIVPSYHASCSDINNKRVVIGTYKSISEAFQAYKVFKEDIIKQVANRYKGVVSDVVYYALLKYEVSEDD